MLLGEQNLRNGNSLFIAILAANAVFPQFGLP
jgi:hypothetical protein